MTDMQKMKILIACEFSGIVRDAFIAKGHDAISCDLLPTEMPGPHYQGDVYDILFKHRWDMIIAFPECTKLCVSGNHVYAKGKPKYQQRLDAARWTEKFWNDCKSIAKKVCFENSKGVLSTMTSMPKPTYIQPHDFGHDASKETGLFLYNLEPLTPTKRIAGRLVEWNGKIIERWENQTDSGQNKLGPSPDRWKLRSETYQGIAEAMAGQWG